jgi:hypothetical protein
MIQVVVRPAHRVVVRTASHSKANNSLLSSVQGHHVYLELAELVKAAGVEAYWR